MRRGRGGRQTGGGFGGGKGLWGRAGAAAQVTPPPGGGGPAAAGASPAPRSSAAGSRGRPCGCGRHGCLEQYASGNALVRAARERAEADPSSAARLLELAGGSADAITGLQVTRAAQEGDPASCAAFAEIGRWLGSGL